METKKELTTKEKILRALEEPSGKPGHMVGGFVGVLFAASIAHTAMGITANGLLEAEKEVIK